MSYYKCKTITLKPKTNQIFVTTASSMLDGNIQISQLNKSTIPFEYALLKMRNYYRENDISEYGNKFDERYERYNKELSKYVDIKNWEECSKFERENRDFVNEIRRDINRDLYRTEF